MFLCDSAGDFFRCGRAIVRRNEHSLLLLLLPVPSPLSTIYCSVSSRLPLRRTTERIFPFSRQSHVCCIVKGTFSASLALERRFFFFCGCAIVCVSFFEDICKMALTEGKDGQPGEAFTTKGETYHSPLIFNFCRVNDHHFVERNISE